MTSKIYFSTLALTCFLAHVQALPVAQPDAYPTNEDEPLLVNAAGVLANDNFNGIPSLSAEILSQPSHGTVSLQANGSFLYIPEPDFHGDDQFSYRAVQEPQPLVFTVDSPASILSIQVSTQTFSTGATTDSQTRTSKVTGSMTASVTPTSLPFGTAQIRKLDLWQTDPISMSLCMSRLGPFCLSYMGISMPGNDLNIFMNMPNDIGQAGPAAAVNAFTGNFTQPGNAVSALGTVYLTGTGLPPSAEINTTQTETFTNANISLSGATLRLAVPLQVIQATAESGNVAAPGLYLVTTRITGTIYATAQVPVLQASQPATVTIHVESVDDAPLAVADSYATKQLSVLNVPAAQGLLVNDSDPESDPLTAEILTQPVGGFAKVQPDGSLTYAAGPGPVGSAEFFYGLRQNGQPVFQKFPLVFPGSDWRVLTATDTPPSGWQGLDFTDGAWPSRSAPLGYGYGDVASTLSFGADFANKKVTHYFRKVISSPIAAELASSLSLRLRADDGAAVWLNGTERWRVNLPGTAGDGSLTPATLALTAVDRPAGNFTDYDVPVSSLFLSGDNLLAVEIHQQSPASDDLVFDLAATLNYRVGAVVSVLIQPGDADADGMADAWEVTAGLNPQVNDSAADPDHDGNSNLTEFLAGTNPQLPASFLRISAVELTPTAFQLTFPSQAEIRYQPQTSNNLRDWQDQGAALQPGANPQAHTGGLRVAGQPFYRLRVVPPWEE